MRSNVTFVPRNETGRHRSDHTTPSSDFLIMLVCTANICRSPMGEWITRAALGPISPITVVSAGIQATPGRPMAVGAEEALRERGVDPEGFGARQLTADLVHAADLVLTGAAAHRRAVVTAVPRAAGRTFTISEFGGLAAAVPARELMQIADPALRAHELVVQARDFRGLVRVGDMDIADPYGGPARGYRVAAQRIADGLAPVLRLLAPKLRRALDVR